MAGANAGTVIGRFAPSPTGRMHAGNIFSALLCWLVVRMQDGRIVLRIEDLDGERSRREHADRIMADLEALGLTWDEGPCYQSDRHERYREVIAELDRRGLLYPCFCTRADLHASAAPHEGEMAVYAGTCRELTADERSKRLEERRRGNSHADATSAYEPALRLRCDSSIIEVDDLFQGIYRCKLDEDCGDFVVRRSNGGASYNLAVVVDDAEQSVNCIVRGSDLLASTPQQIHLQRMLGYRTPEYGHIPLLVDERGVRLAKRQRSASLEEMLARSGTIEAMLGHLCHMTGLIEEEEPMTPERLLKRLTLQELLDRFHGVNRIVFTG